MKETAIWLKEIAIQLQIMNRKAMEPETYQVYGMLSEQSLVEQIRYAHPTEKGGAE